MAKRNGEKIFENIYEVGVYPKKTGDKVELFAYLIPSNPMQRRKIVKLSGVKEVKIYEKNKLKERYTGSAPARTVRMHDATCEFDGEKLICKTDRIQFMKKRNKRSSKKKGGR